MSTPPSAGPRLSYRPPAGGIAAPADYPDAPISLVIERSTPGADLFGVEVAIGGEIPLHSHSMMEFQYVVSGSGLALNADGEELAISPGGTVVSPAGPAGAHGFRNTGPLPLTLLCLYPSPGGATPDRSPFAPGTDVGEGPRTTYVGPEAVRQVPGATGVRVARILDEADPGAELQATLVAIDDEVVRHHHLVCQAHYVVAGHGVVIDADGHETAIAPGGLVCCPAGPTGAHALRNTGSLPLQLLSISPLADGQSGDEVPA